MLFFFMKETQKIKVSGEERQGMWVELIPRENTNAPGLPNLAMNLKLSAVQRETQIPRNRSGGCPEATPVEGMGAMEEAMKVAEENLRLPVVH